MITIEEALEKAKIDYPIGTNFIPIYKNWNSSRKTDFYTVTDIPKIRDNKISIGSIEKGGRKENWTIFSLDIFRNHDIPINTWPIIINQKKNREQFIQDIFKI